jgi:hypothetical protein
MKDFVIWPVVLLATASEPAEHGKAPQKSGACGKTEGMPKEPVVDLGGGVKMEMVLVPAEKCNSSAGQKSWIIGNATTNNLRNEPAYPPSPQSF